MRLDEIRKLVTESQPEDWHKMTVGGTAAPSYKQTLVTHKINDEPAETVAEEHGYLAVYKEDVDLSIAWGLEEDGYYGDRKEYVFPFLDNFANKGVRKITLDVFWAGNLVDRHTLLSVDGWRAYLPIPEFRIIGNGSSEEYFSTESLVYARLAHKLTNVEDFYQYVSMSGLKEMSRADARKA